MKKCFLTISAMIAISGIIASIHFNDLLFGISFLWVLVNGLTGFSDNQ